MRTKQKTIGLLCFLVSIFWATDAFAEQRTISICNQKVPINSRSLKVDAFPQQRNCSTNHLLQISKLTQLTELNLSGDEVTDRVLSALQNHPSLEKIIIYSDQITNSGLRHLATAQRLSSIDLHGNLQLTGSGLAHLTALPRLERLALAPSQVTDIGMVHVSRMKKLVRIETGYPSDEVFLDCSGAPFCYDLEGGTVTNRGIAQLTKAHIAHLIVDPGVVDDQTLALLARMPSLESFNCVTAGNGGEAIGCFDFSGATGITSRGLRHLEKIPMIHLNVPPSSIDRRGLLRLSKIALDSLNCISCKVEGCCHDWCDVRVLESGCFDLLGAPLSGDDLAPLRKFGVSKLILPQKMEFTPKAGRAVFPLPGLSSLNDNEPGVADLRDSRIKAESLEMLWKAGLIHTLRLGKVESADSLAKHLKKATSIETLVIEKGQKVAESQAKALLSLPKLLNLSIPGESLNGALVDAALDHPNLGALNFDAQPCRQTCEMRQQRCFMCDEICEELVRGECETLCRYRKGSMFLNLRGSNVSLSDVRGFSRAKRKVFLFMDRVTDDDLDRVTKLGRVQSLNCLVPNCIRLDRQKVTEGGLRHLLRLPKLKRLSLPEELLTDKTLAILGKLKKLEALNTSLDRKGEFNLGRKSSYSAKGIGKLTALGSLLRINMDSKRIDDSMLSSLVRLPKLVSLNCGVHRNDMGDEDCIDLRRTLVTEKGLTSLSKLRMAGDFIIPRKLMSDQILKIVTSRPRFDSLNCEVECPDCAGGSMPCLSPSCIDLSNTRISDNAIRSLRRLKLKTVIAYEEESEKLRKLLPKAKVVVNVGDLFGGR